MNHQNQFHMVLIDLKEFEKNFYLINLNKNLNLILIMKLLYLYKQDDEKQNHLKYFHYLMLFDLKKYIYFNLQKEFFFLIVPDGELFDKICSFIDDGGGNLC